MRYRVEQLAAACDVSVDTVRYYQSRGLVPPPEREGRVAWYDTAHAERIREVRALQRQGLSLAAIGRVLDGELGAADADSRAPWRRPGATRAGGAPDARSVRRTGAGFLHR